MSLSELAHLELLAEVDTLVDRLNRWAEDAPAWQPAEKCRALVRRLTQRAASLRVRIEAPLLVATLGGTGTGKSALLNALVGAEIVQTGRSRPTTTRPTLVSRPGLTPEMLDIDPACVEVIHRDLPALRDLVLIDCPDPDTTEDDNSTLGRQLHCRPGSGSATAAPTVDEASSLVPRPPSLAPSNLARLRAILPHCDVLLVTATQQKYRSARVADELAAAAPGAHLVFVQTHADLDDDIRDDWRSVLDAGSWGGSCTATPRGDSATVAPTQFGHIFRVDSLRALADAQAGLQPRGEFADLLDLLTRQMSGAAANRIRRANFLDLAADTLERCGARIDEALPGVREVQTAVDQQRGVLAQQMAAKMQSELLASRRQWENRLLAQAASHWGLSPFALVLRIYQGIGGLLSGALLYRARTPAQMALWGALEGVRTWRRHRQTRQADRSVNPAGVGPFEPAELRKAAIIVEGYVAEAGLRVGQWGRHSCLPKAGKNACPTLFDEVAAEAETAAGGFVARVAAELEALVARLAARHTGWFTRFRYEILLAAMLGMLLYRLGRNFFYDSWLAEQPLPVLGLDFYLSAGFWLVLWCLLLLWMFCRRLRRGLRGELDRLAAGWQEGSAAAGIFAQVENECRDAERFSQDIETIRHDVDGLRRQVTQCR